MDEPFGALDEIVRDRLNEEVLKLWGRTGKTICFVTHSIPEAVYLSTKIVVMSPRPGRITDVIDSPLPKERPLDIRDSPEFIEIAHRVREGLQGWTWGWGMNGIVLAYLAGSTAVFMAANATLKTYAVKGGPWVLIGALALFCLGNYLMVRVMRENGLGPRDCAVADIPADRDYRDGLCGVW